jgi:protein SCO1
MSHSKRKAVQIASWIVSGLVVLGLVAAGLHAHRADVQREARESFYSSFADLTLTDQTGRRFDFSVLSGKVVLVNFVFTRCPSVCPTQTAALVRVQQSLTAHERDAVHFVSVSLDPENDTPKALLAFARQFGAESLPWSFIVSPPEDLTRLEKRLRLFADDSTEARPNGHNATLWLVDGLGRLVQQYQAPPTDAQRLTREIKALLAAGA